MFNLIENGTSIVLISLGAVLGSISRAQAIYSLEYIFNIKHTAILIVNLFSTFLLGILSSVILKFDSFEAIDSLWLFLGIGFLGSFSTFSTFILNLFDLIQESKFRDFLYLLSLSIFGGIIFAWLGFILVND